MYHTRGVYTNHYTTDIDWECKIILKVFENKQAEKPKQDSQNGLRLHMPEGDLNNNYII
jgi:hypothetical protein